MKYPVILTHNLYVFHSLKSDKTFLIWSRYAWRANIEIQLHDRAFFKSDFLDVEPYEHHRQESDAYDVYDRMDLMCSVYGSGITEKQLKTRGAFTVGADHYETLILDEA